MFSLSCSIGGLTTIGSYNKSKTNCYYNAIVVVIADTFTSIMAGFALFSFLGHTAKMFGKNGEMLLPNSTVLRGPKVALIGMPFLTSHGTSHEFFIAVVFFMFLVFACGTQYVGLEVVFTAIDQIKVVINY